MFDHEVEIFVQPRWMISLRECAESLSFIAGDQCYSLTNILDKSGLYLFYDAIFFLYTKLASIGIIWT